MPCRALLLTGLLLLLAAAPRADARERLPHPLPAANNAFAWDLYGQIRGGEGNLFFSPYSISAALWMAREGARGETAAEMDRVLHLGGANAGNHWAGLVAALRAPQVRDGNGPAGRRVPAYEIHVANALWGQQAYPFHDAFTKRLADVYRAPLRRIDFSDAAGARRAINAWVEENTRDKIKDIVPEGLPPPQTRLAIANAIYFKAPWADSFSERATKPGRFAVPGTEGVDVPLMHKVHRYAYADLGAAQAIEIPYRGNATSMLVLLPKEGESLDAVEQSVLDGALKGWASRLGSMARVDLKLPPFSFTRDLDLTGLLPRMGMKQAFDAKRADFSGMTAAERLFIGAVLHKAFIKLDEQGTEAAAATVMFLKGEAAEPPSKPVVFHATRPFLFLIRHRPTGTILFLGRVTDPT